MIRDMNSGRWAKGEGVKGVLRPKLFAVASKPMSEKSAKHERKRR